MNLYIRILLISLFCFSQNNFKPIYISEKSYASITDLNKIQVTIEKNGFLEKEWEELVASNFFL